MSTETRRKWIAAARVLSVDPTAPVRCPERDDGTLTVRDEVSRADPSVMERYLVCPTCGARNVIRMPAPASS